MMLIIFLFIILVVSFVLTIIAFHKINVSYRRKWVRMSNVTLAITVLLLVANITLAAVIVHDNSTEPVIEQISIDKKRREEILAICEKAQESHDKHRQTSARAIVDVWNYKVKATKERKDNFWIGIFFSNDVADAMEYIEVNE